MARSARVWVESGKVEVITARTLTRREMALPHYWRLRPRVM
jgi:hypothetical protein